MNRQALLGVVAAVLGSLVVLAGAVALLRPEGAGEAPEEASASAAPQAVAPRPDCPGPTVGGVALDCLGGDHQPADGQDITLVNVWAWWCLPCRDELPAIADYARQHPEVEVVGVHADPAAGRGAALLDELGVDLPSYQDNDNTFAGTLGLPGVIPITLVFRGNEQLAVFPRTFASAAEVDAAVSGVL